MVAVDQERTPPGFFVSARNCTLPEIHRRPKTHTPLPHLQVSGLRYYSPELGRWTSRDSIGEIGGDNLYIFALNSPLDNFDVVGLWPSPIINDLGYRPPQGDPSGKNLYGFTDVDYRVIPSTPRCASDARLCDVVISASASIDYWYAQGVYPSRKWPPLLSYRLHEKEHVKIAKTVWANMGSDVEPLERKCICCDKAICYVGVINQLTAWHKMERAVRNAQFHFDEMRIGSWQHRKAEGVLNAQPPSHRKKEYKKIMKAKTNCDKM